MAPRTQTTEVIPRVDPQDPILDDAYDVDGDPAYEFSLAVQDPNRHYVWAENSPGGIAAYAHKGYEIERFYAEQVRVRMRAPLPGLNEGDPLVARDHILMSCDKARHDRREAALRRNKDAIRQPLYKNAEKETRLGGSDSGGPTSHQTFSVS